MIAKLGDDQRAFDKCRTNFLETATFIVSASGFAVALIASGNSVADDSNAYPEHYNTTDENGELFAYHEDALTADQTLIALTMFIQAAFHTLGAVSIDAIALVLNDRKQNVVEKKDRHLQNTKDEVATLCRESADIEFRKSEIGEAMQ